MSRVRIKQIRHPDSTVDNLVVNQDGSVSTLGGVLSPQTGFKNRVINGDMRIDQRNNGAAVTVTVSGLTFIVDRFYGSGNPAKGVYTAEQFDISSLPGFSYSLKMTTTTADASISASQNYGIAQRIEGYNIADFAFGTASASTVTLSFWVRSSLTGTFGGAIRNAAFDRSYVYSYTVNSANTWEYKTIVISGDTTGTWNSDNQLGILVTWSLGAGSSLLSSPGSWVAGNYSAPTGQVNLISTLNATLEITGVQLEKGSVATPFEFRSIGQELALCQRYYQEFGGSTSYQYLVTVAAGSTTLARGAIIFPVPMRASPSFTHTGASGFALEGDGYIVCSSLNLTYGNADTVNIIAEVASGLAAGKAYVFMTNNSTASKLRFSAEP